MPERRNESSAAQGHGDTIRTALQGAMVGSWGRENALRALAELEAEFEQVVGLVEVYGSDELIRLVREVVR